MEAETPLILELRENKLRDCLVKMCKRWLEAFQRKGVRFEVNLDPSIPTFRFDYQKLSRSRPTCSTMR